MPEPSDMQLFSRWCRDSGNHVAVDAVKRWVLMKPSSRAALLARWREEDAKKKGKT